MKSEIITKHAEENSKDIHEFFLASKMEIEKVKRRKKQFTISLVALCSFSLVGFVFVFLLWRNSEKLQAQIENTSKANSIATKAYTLLEHDPTLAFRLAEESYKVDPTPLNKQVIMAAYAQVPFYEKLQGHSSVLRTIKISKSGKLLLTGSDDNTAIIWNNQGIILKILKGHEGRISGPGNDCIDLSEDDKYFLTSSADSTARLWNIKGDCLSILQHNGPINSVCFSPDYKKILTTSSDKKARIWDLKGKELIKFDIGASGKKGLFLKLSELILISAGKSLLAFDASGKILVKMEFDDPVFDFDISNDEKTLAIGTTKNLFLYGLNGKLIAKLNGHKDVKFNTQNDKLIARHNDLEFILHDLINKSEVIGRGHTAKLWNIGWSPSNQQIISASDDGTSRLWNLEGHEIMQLKGHTSQVFSAQFSPDGKQIVTASGDKTARIWTIEPDENPILKGHTGYVVDANFSPDGEKIVTAAFDYSSRIWEKSGKEYLQFKQHSHYAIGNALFDYSGKFIYSQSADETIMKWDQTGKVHQTFRHNSWDKKIKLKDSLIFTQSGNKSILWNINRDSIQLFPKTIFSSFLKNSKEIIFTFSSDSLFHFWRRNYNNGAPFFNKFLQIQLPLTSFASAEFSSDGKWMATTSEDSTIRIWDLQEILFMDKNLRDTSIIKIGSEKVKHQIKLNSIITSLHFSPGENIFISNSNDNIMRLWDIAGKQLAEFIGHSDGITDINFSPDGQFIASSSFDKSLRRWNLKGEEIMNYSGHTGAVNRARFSPDGKYLLSCSIDHTARLMPVTIEQVLSKINKEKVRGQVYKLSEQELKVYGVK